MKGRDLPPLLEVRNLSKHYPRPGGWLAPAAPPLRAVDDVSFDIKPAQTLALVGESGSGKTTLAKAVVRLIEPNAGAILFNGEDLLALGPREMRMRRRDIQIVFQDPYASLNPRLKVVDIVSEPLENFSLGMSRLEQRERALALLAKVQLPPELAQRYPHELSGGQRQRVAIARALAPQPRLIVCDEPVSALDVTVQAQVIHLLMDLQAELGVAYLFVTHNLAVVRQMAHQVAVMRHGRIVETNDCAALFAQPRHPYTRALLAASVPLSRPGRANFQLPEDQPALRA